MPSPTPRRARAPSLTLLAAGLGLLPAVAAFGQEPTPAIDYVLDAGRSDLYVQIYKDPDALAQAFAHDHVVQARGWSGTVHWDSADPAACRIDISVPVGGLRTDDGTMRQKLGYTTSPSDGQRETIRESMLSEGQLWADRFPLITYRGTSCTRVSGGSGDTYAVTGVLSVRGVGKQLTVPMTITADGQRFTAAGKFDANCTDFGFAPYSGLLGTVKVLDRLSFTVDVKGAAP